MTIAEQKKTWRDVPLSELISAAREHPQMQATIGWHILCCAAAAGIKSGEELIRAIHVHEQSLEALEEVNDWLDPGTPSEVFRKVDTAIAAAKGEES